MPQGGAGKCGGALGSKSGKPKGGKKRVVKTVKSKGAAKATGEGEAHNNDTPAEHAAGHVEVAPSPARRAALMRARAAGEAAMRERADAKAAAARCPVNGTAPSGAVLGGGGAASADAPPAPPDLHQAASGEDDDEDDDDNSDTDTDTDTDIDNDNDNDKASSNDIDNDNDVSAKRSATRDARLRFYNQQRAQRRAAAAPHPPPSPPDDNASAVRSTPARAAAAAEAGDTKCAAGGASNASSVVADSDASAGVASLLDRFAARRHAASGGGGAQRSIVTLRTVLGNAARRGAEAEPRFRQLRARNDALWTHVLRHGELRAVLESAGFARRLEADDDGGAAAASAGEGAGAAAVAAPADGGDDAASHRREDALERARCELEALFQGDGAPDAAAAEALLARIDALAAAAPPAAARAPAARAAAEEVCGEERGWVFVHDGGERADAALAVALEVARAWSSLATKSVH